jgi:hypothetical protein
MSVCFMTGYFNCIYSRYKQRVFLIELLGRLRCGGGLLAGSYRAKKNSPDKIR